jgi:hypothetical protein
VLELPGLPEKGDVSDWLAAGGTLDQLEELAVAAPEWQPTAAPEEIRSAYWTLDDIKALEPPEWIVEGLLPRRVKALIFGESGHYKTMHAVDQLCRVAHLWTTTGSRSRFPAPSCSSPTKTRTAWPSSASRAGTSTTVSPAGASSSRRATPSSISRTMYNGCSPAPATPSAMKEPSTASTHGIAASAATLTQPKTSTPLSTDSTHSWPPASSPSPSRIHHGAIRTAPRAVTFWANHDTRIKVEKDEATGRGALTVIHHKNARAGLELGFDFEQFDFDHRGTPTNTLIPQRNFDHKPKTETRRKPLGSNEQLVLDALTKAIAEQADTPPPATSIPQNAKVCSVERWRHTALLVLPQPEPKRKGEAFNRAMLSLVASGSVRHFSGVAWLP